MAFKFFPYTMLLLKVDCFEGLLNQIKIDRMVNNNLAAVTRSDFKKSTQISLKTVCNF